MDQKEYSFNALPAGAFSTGLDNLLDQVRSQAVNQLSPLKTSGVLVSENVLLIPIAVVQKAVEEAYRMGSQDSTIAVEIAREESGL